MAVFAALAVSPAVAKDEHFRTDETYIIGGDHAVQDSDFITDETYYKKEKIKSYTTPWGYEYAADYKYYYHGDSLEMTGSASNKIVSKDFSFLGYTLPGYVLGDTQPNVNADGYVKMSTETGYNAIVGSVTGPVTFNLGWDITVGGGRPNVTAGGNVYMDGPANAVMLGSTINGTNITLENSRNQTTKIGTVTDGILGGLANGRIPDNIKDIEGIFNIVQGSKLIATESVTLNTATDTAVNKLKANIITGGQGDLSTLVNPLIEEKLGEGWIADTVTSAVNNSIKNNDSGSSITAGTDINLLGGASVIVDTTLSDLLNFGTSKDFAALLAGKENNSTTVTLNAGKNLNLDSIINMAYAAQGGVNLSAGTASGVVGAINATGALNVIGGKTTLTADNINLTPGTSVSINKLVSELKQLGDFMPVDLSSITGKLGALADQNVNASIVAGGATLEANGTGDNGNISLSGTAGIVVNTKVTDVLGALGDLQAGHEMLFAQKVLESSAETSLTASRDINVGAQLNVLHGGFAKDDKTNEIVIGKNTLTITAGSDVKLHGAANLVSGNVQVNAGSVDDEGNIKVGNIHLEGYPLNSQLAGAAAGFANGLVKDMGIDNAGVSGMIGKLAQKGSFNVVTGGATLNATGDIIMDAKSVDDVGKVGNINAVLDTQFTDVITAVINGEPSAILPTDKEGVFKPTTTLTAGGNIDLLGRVNVVNGLRGNVVVDADGDVNLQGNLSMVSGNASVTGKTININTSEAEKYKMYVDSSELSILPDFAILDKIGGAIEGVAMNAAVVAGGANLTSEGVDEKGNGITIGGTVGLLMNTPVADAIKELNPLNPGKNPSELEIVESLLQKGTATSLTAKEGNILVGSQFNLVHGGGFTNVADENAFTLTAEKGNVNVEGTANVVSGNVQVKAKDITMTGEVLPADMAKAANGLVGSLTEEMGISGVSGVLNKLVNKGSVNMVTGGATLTATAVENAEGEMVGGDITMTGKSVDDVGKIGNINAVIDTEIVDVLQAKDGDFGSLVHGGGHMTTLQADGNINLEGRVNVVNGKYVTLDAGKDINLQGNLSMIGGATVNADGNININTSTEDKYKMYLDAEELGALMPGGITLPDGLDGVVENTGVNAAVIAGGAKLEADGDITTGGTAGILVNTPMAEVGDRVMSLLTNPNHLDETWMVYELLQKGIATTVTSTNGNIELGSQLNVLHGGNMGNADAALKLSAANGAIKLNGTLNMVSGNVKMDAESINMTGEALKYNLGDGLAGMPGAEVLDKLNTYGSANVVLGGATLTATGEEGITMKGLANAVLDVELVDGVEAFMDRPDMSSLMQGGAYETTLHATTGDINLLGRFNVVNGGKVSLLADKGDVNVNGGVSFIGGGATVTANNIKLNDDETGKYQMYFDSEELGAILPAGSPITEMLDTFGVTDLLGTTGVNAAIVAGGANLKATGDITTGGTVSMLVNTPLSEVMKELESYTKHEQETWMAYQLLQKGAATTVHADGNINLASRLNLLHGGNFGENNANALSLTAGKDVKMNGSANVVSGNVIVKADNDITMTGEALKFDMESGVEMLDKLAAQGSTNIVTGGATLTATNNIKLDSMANFVLDTEATDLVEVFMERKPDAVAQGGNHMTTLKADGNIDLVGRMNVVNGAYVTLEAGKDVNINGTLNMVSGKAKVNGANINLNGQTSVGLNWGEIIPGVVGDYVDGVGLTDKLNKGVNGNLVLGGSTLTATNDIKMTGMASVVTNVPLGSAFEALNKKMDETWQPELWLIKDMINDGIATTLTATNGNIEMTSRLNMLHGGNMGNADAALKLTAGKEVIIAGTANIISGNTQVIAGEGITVTGKTGVGFDWDKVVDVLPDKYAGYGELAGQMGILAKLEKGVNGSVIAGGATLTAKSGDITMEGMATAVVDVTAENVLTAVETMNGTPIMEGGTHATTITAEQGNINLNSRLNLVNGGKVTLEATKGSVNMNGTFNTVSGNATVKAGANIEMNAQNKVGVDISPVLDGHYAEIAKDLGMADVLKNGVSSNIVAGGAKLDATGDVKMSGVATAIVDTTASNVIGAVKGDNLGELMKGGRDKTEVKAGKDIVLESQMNLVNGGNTKNAGGVLLDAGNNVIVGGQVSVVNRAEIKAGQNVNFNSGNTVVKYSDIAAGKVAFKGNTAEITDVKFNNASVDVLGTQLVNTLGSDVLDIGHLNVAEMGSIENLGSLTVTEATLSGATLYNAGSIIVSNKMTLDSATLSFVANEKNVTLNHTAIVLGDGVKTLVDGTGDMLAGLHFELNYGALNFIDDSNVFAFNLAIFEGITEEQTGWLNDALADGEFSITLTNGFRVDDYTNVKIEWENNVAYVTGSASVPEPTTATLSLLALAALAARRRRK